MSNPAAARQGWHPPGRAGGPAGRRAWLLAGLLAAGWAAPAGRAQYGGTEAPGLETSAIVRLKGGDLLDEDQVHTAREAASHSTGTPVWSNPAAFSKDVFTYARIVFKSSPGFGSGPKRGWRLGWWVDFPDADLNFSYRLQQLTTIPSDPDGRVIKLTDPTLTGYPLITMEHPGYIHLHDQEVGALRNYLLNGGALLVIDFWSTREWEGFEAQMKEVLPGRTWKEIGTDHPIFHQVYNLPGNLQDFQVPTLQYWNPSFDKQDPNSRITVFRGEGSERVHVRGWEDDQGRLMVLAVHNSDIPDGWEREAENAAYFKTFSEKIAYPLGINLLVYFMTH